MTDAEIEMTADLVRELLREQHPDLAGLPIREVAGGWGNQMWRLGDELAVRMQRMDATHGPQLNERRWLPLLASRLPLPIPTPVRSGTPSARFPKIWTVMTWVEGTPLDHGSITRGDDAADRLADFLKALHVEAPADAPGTSGGFGAPLKEAAGGFEHFLRAVDLGDFAEDDIRAVWDDALAASEWQGPALWIHGDLHPANVVVADGTLAGVVDFDALSIGDPPWDLAAARVLLPPGTTARLFPADAEGDEATIPGGRGPGRGPRPSGRRAGRPRCGCPRRPAPRRRSCR